MLLVRNFSKAYGATIILEIGELDFTPGVHWIRGENGSGKTTLFKSLAGLLPCKGNVSLENKISLHEHPVNYRKVVNYGEAEPLYPGFLTAKDLIRFVGKAKGASLQQQEELARLFGVDNYFESPCETFSSGMTKKLSLVLAFLGTPKVVILDEPLITLDEHARRVLFTIIEKILSERNAVFLISSHQAWETDLLKITASYHISNKSIQRL